MKDEEIKKEIEDLVKQAFVLSENDGDNDLWDSVIEKLADLTDYGFWEFKYISECETKYNPNPKSTNPFITEVVGHTLYNRLPEEEKEEIFL